jgi:thioredoxin reductase
MEEKAKFDTIIIGGSYAGLSAAMALGRAIRQVLVLDSGKPCNQQTPHSHNFLTQDGSTPAAIAAQAKAQVAAYPTIQFRSEAAVEAQGVDNHFTVTTATGQVVQARKLLFATGVRDLLPALPGFAESWGISTIHCPYCHGYEYRDQLTGILMNGDMAFEQARLIHNWTKQLTIYTNGPSSLRPEHRQQLAALQVDIVEAPVLRLAHDNGYLTHLELADGRAVPLNALYARPPFEQHCPLPLALGCTHTEAGHIVVDAFQKTSVPGIYAAGDATTMMRAVSMAVAAGGVAGAMLNRELLELA